MKIRTLIVILLFSNSLFSFGQKYQKSMDPYETKSGEIFKVGDRVYITEPSQFRNAFTSIYKNKYFNSRYLIAEKYTDSSGKVSYTDNIYRYGTIKHFLKRPDGIMCAVLSINALSKIYIDIDAAIKSDEITNVNKLSYKSLFEPKSDMSNKKTYLHYIYYKGEIDNNSTMEYMYLFHNSKYNLIKEDEFELHKGMKDVKNEINGQISYIDTAKIYSIVISDKFGLYDFDKEAFPVNWNAKLFRLLNKPTFARGTQDFVTNGIQFVDLNVRFNNLDKFEYVPINMEQADLFVKEKKDEYGNVDRSVIMVIDYRILGLEDDDKSCFSAEIKSIDFFGNNGDRYVSRYHWWLNRIELK